MTRKRSHGPTARHKSLLLMFVNPDTEEVDPELEPRHIGSLAEGRPIALKYLAGCRAQGRAGLVWVVSLPDWYVIYEFVTTRDGSDLAGARQAGGGKGVCN